MPYTDKTFDRAIEISATELHRSSLKLVEDLVKFDWFGLTRSFLFTDHVSLAKYSNQLLDLLGEFFIRLQVLPARVAAFMAAESLDLPKAFSQRVVRGDVSLRFTVKEVIDTGFDVALGNFLPIYDVFKGFERMFLRLRVVAFLDGIAFLRLAKGTILQIILLVLKIAWAFMVSIGVVVIVHTLAHKFNQDSYKKVVFSNFLADDSIRIRRWPKERRQFRVNTKPGPDT